MNPKTAHCCNGHPYRADATALAAMPDDRRPPCPVCGSRSYHFTTAVSVHATQGHSVSLTAHKLPGSSGESIRNQRGGDDPRVAAADIEASGVLSDRVEGVAPPTRSSELRAARLLVERLNSVGESWSPPRLQDEDAREEGFDAWAMDGLQMLKVQVTTPEDTAWGLLGQQKKLGKQPELVRSESDVAAAVDAVKRAIERKEPFAGRDEIVLALDATDSNRYALQKVVDMFRSRHGAWAKSVGYRAVWMVGPAPDLVNRLDVES